MAAGTCYSCGSELTYSGETVGRGESCPKCRRDVRCCRNCKHYDRASYNECRETQAERVVDKEKANFCDYFTLGTGASGKSGDAKANILQQLDSLFKK